MNQKSGIFIEIVTANIYMLIIYIGNKNGLSPL